MTGWTTSDRTSYLLFKPKPHVGTPKMALQQQRVRADLFVLLPSGVTMNKSPFSTLHYGFLTDLFKEGG